jgi:predicted phage tail component-like protein
MKGVLFGEKHTFNDWGLTLTSRPVISPPVPKTLYVDIPGGDGVLDLTNALSEDVKYENRTITFEFNVLDARNRWSNIYSDILDYLHGQSMKIILDEDPTYYYTGRVQVNEWKSDKRTSTITIEANVEPYKMAVVSTVEDWLWDSFNFETDVIQYFADIPFDATETAAGFNCVVKGRKWVIPTITFTTEDGSPVKVIIRARNGWNTIPYESGVPTKLYGLVWSPGEWGFYIPAGYAGKGTMTIDYREGRL